MQCMSSRSSPVIGLKLCEDHVALDFTTKMTAGSRLRKADRVNKHAVGSASCHLADCQVVHEPLTSLLRTL